MLKKKNLQKQVSNQVFVGEKVNVGLIQEYDYAEIFRRQSQMRAYEFHIQFL